MLLESQERIFWWSQSAISIPYASLSNHKNLSNRHFITSTGTMEHTSVRLLSYTPYAPIDVARACQRDSALSVNRQRSERHVYGPARGPDTTTRGGTHYARGRANSYTSIVVKGWTGDAVLSAASYLHP